MMVQVKEETLEGRILRILVRVYPITTKELRKELGLSKMIVDRALHHLVRQGIIELEELPDKTFIRLLKSVSFVGTRADQRKALKRKGGVKVEDYEGIMYG